MFYIYNRKVLVIIYLFSGFRVFKYSPSKWDWIYNKIKNKIKLVCYWFVCSLTDVQFYKTSLVPPCADLAERKHKYVSKQSPQPES